MNARTLACYSPALVCLGWAVVAAVNGHDPAVAFLITLAVSVVAHIRWGR